MDGGLLECSGRCLDQPFFETRALVQKGIFSEQLAGQYLMAEGGLAILGVIVAVLAWRQWFLYDKKKNDPNDQK